MKIIDSYLDKYFSKKVNELINRYLTDKGKKTIIYFDDAFQEYHIEIKKNNPELKGSIPYFKYKQSQSIEVLINLLINGFSHLDSDYCRLEIMLKNIK